MITIQQINDYLSEHISDPVPKYIFIKEICKKDPISPEYVSAYDKMKQSKWYQELADDQLDNGSWGSHHGGAIKAQRGHKFGGTEPALRRARELSLTKDDPIIAKCIKIMERYVSRDEPYPDRIEKHKDNGKGHYLTIPFEVAASINLFDPDNPIIKPFRDIVADNIKIAFENGCFDREVFQQAVNDYRLPGMFEPGNPFDVYLLQNGECMGDILQRQYLSYIWNGEAKNVYISNMACTDKQILEDKTFIEWLTKLEIISDFRLFPEFMNDTILPHLLNESKRLICDDVVLPNLPSGHGTTCSHNVYGRYAESWRDKDKRKTDMVLRIARILAKC